MGESGKVPSAAVVSLLHSMLLVAFFGPICHILERKWKITHIKLLRCGSMTFGRRLHL